MADKHVYIFGEIGEVTTVKSVAEQTNGATKSDTIVLHIHSPGGSVDEGFAIYDHLLSLGCEIETRIEGICASIATIPALAGKVRSVSPNSKLLVHNPWKETQGDANAHIKSAEMLLEVEGRIAAFYAEKLGKTTEEMLALMAKDEPMDAAAALELGFATVKTEPVMAMAYINKSVTNNSNIETIMSTFIDKMEAKIKALLTPNSTAVKNLSATLEDGTAIEISGEEIVAGASVMNADGSTAADGTYTLSDGIEITVAEGLITAVSTVMEDATALTEQVAALTAENADLKSQLQTIENKFDEFVKNLEQKQPIFNRVQRKPTEKRNDKPADRTGGAAAIKARLNPTKK
jgi:ATP-dependent protease ClpP protease subunit